MVDEEPEVKDVGEVDDPDVELDERETMAEEDEEIIPVELPLLVVDETVVGEAVEDILVPTEEVVDGIVVDADDPVEAPDVLVTSDVMLGPADVAIDVEVSEPLVAADVVLDVVEETPAPGVSVILG